MSYTKPFLTVEQQLALLKQRGLIITDEPKAEALLRRIGYYRLSGYWYPFRQYSGHGRQRQVFDTFRTGATFSSVVDLYVFDKKLRLLVLDALERIEIALKCSIALRLGQQDPDAHRDAQWFSGRFLTDTNNRTGQPKHHEWLSRIDEAFGRSKEDFVKHFKARYAGSTPPVWISVEVWDFGAMSTLFQYMKPTDKDAIAHEYGVPTGAMMESWLRSLNYVRNVCAHHSRLWNHPLVQSPSYPALGTLAELDHVAGSTPDAERSRKRFYGAAAVIRLLLRTVNPGTTWPQRLADHMHTLPAVKPLNLGQAGFPQGWEQQDLWRPESVQPESDQTATPAPSTEEEPPQTDAQ